MGYGIYYMVFGHLKGTVDEGQYIIADDVEADSKSDAIKKVRKLFPNWSVVSALSPKEIYHGITPNDEKEMWNSRKQYDQEIRRTKSKTPNFMRL